MSNAKRSDNWISFFAFIGIMLLVATFAVAITAHMVITVASIFLALVPSIVYWSWFCLDLWRHNLRPQYVFQWIDLITDQERRADGSSFEEAYEPPFTLKKAQTPIAIRHKISGIGGSSALIVPDDCPVQNIGGWSVDRSSTVNSIVLIDRSGMKAPVVSVKSVIWLINRSSVIDAIERGRSDEDRAFQYGRQRDELIGALLCLERLVDQQRDTFGNSPYGQLVRHYTNKVLHRLLEQDVDLTRSVFVERMESWQHLADQCITRFGRR